MAKDRRTNSTQQPRKGPGRRGGSNIANEPEYIQKTKSRLGDLQALRDHEMRHQPGATNPCELKEKNCRQYMQWLILELLLVAETATLFGPDLRELAAVMTEQVTDAERTVAILDHLIPRVGDRDVVQTFRDYFADLRESNEKIRSHLFGSAASDGMFDVSAKHPLERFRDRATMLLGHARYPYQDIAYLVDAHIVDEGDYDRTRKSRAWRAVVEELKRRGKSPPKKRRV